MTALVSDWLRHFRLLLWNRSTDFNDTWQEARSQRPLPSLCFRADRKNRMAALAYPGLDIFDFSSETAKQNSTKLDRKQDLNQQRPLPSTSMCFSGRSENKMTALASDWLKHFRLLLWNCYTEFNETWQEAISQRPLPSLCFSGRSEKHDARPGLWLAETVSTSPLKPLEWYSLRGSKISTSSDKSLFFGPIEKKKTKLPSLSLIGWGIFDSSSETAQRISSTLDKKLDLNVLY